MDPHHSSATPPPPSLPLQIKALAGNCMDPRQFGFIDPPPDDGLEAAIISLKQV